MKNVKKIAIVSLLFVMQTAIVFANSWTLEEVDEQLTLTDETGKVCDVFSDTDILPETVEKISATLDILWGIPGLTGSQCSVRVEPENYFYFILYPDSLVYRDVELKKFLPSGLSFRYDTALFYDITLKVDEYLPRVSGAYVSPSDFLSQLYSVSTMPELSLQGDVLLQRIARIEQALMAISKKSLFSKPSIVSEDIVLAVVALHNQNNSITIDEVAANLKEQGIEASKADVEAVFMVYLGEFE